MKRRGFFAAAVGLAAGLFGGPAAEERPAISASSHGLQEVHRIGHGGSPVRLRMMHLRAGDRFTMSGHPGYVWEALSDPSLQEDRPGEWGIQARAVCMPLRECA